MNILLRIGFGLFSLIACLRSVAAVADQPLASLPPPIADTAVNNHYSSPYGPRNLSGKGYQFHQGVDYNYALRTPIYAVQGGGVDAIGLDGANDWILPIIGDSTDPFPYARFSYIHLFDDSWMTTYPRPNDPEANVIYGSAQVNLTENGNPISQVTLEAVGQISDCYAIVFWTDFANDIAEKALSSCGGISVGGKLTKTTVSQGELIAVVGQSGAAAGHPHLHLQVNSGDQNELLYVKHDNSDPPAYTISIFKDKGASQTDLDANKVQLHGGEVLDPTQDSPLRIRTEVSYATAGHDLDEVQIIMYKEGATEPNLTTLNKEAVDCLLSGLCKDFNYGGTGIGRSISTLHCSSQHPCDPIQGGVYGQLHNGGVVDFLTDPIDLTTLDPGNYIILVRTFNILAQSEQASLTVTIPPPPFTATASCDGPFPDNTGSNFYDTITIHERFSYPFPPHFNINRAPSFLDIPTDPSDPSNPLFPSLASYTSVQRPSYVNTHQLYMGYLSSVMATFLKPNPNWTTAAPGGAFRIILDNGQMTCQASVTNEGYFPAYVCTTHSSLSNQDVIDWGISLPFYTPAYCDSPSTFNGVPSCDHYTPLPLGNFSISVPFPEFPDSTTPTPPPKQISLACP